MRRMRGSGPQILIAATAIVSLLTVPVAASPAVDARPPLAQEIAELEARLAESPKDVDVRLKLAFRLSWQGRRKAARGHAVRVVKAAPSYWDAHLLLARIDAWEGEYRAARGRIERVLASVPGHGEALALAADVGLWSRRLGEAEAALKALIEREPSADLYFKLARVYMERMDTLAARRYADKALSLDPDHRQARALRDGVHLVKLYATTQTEVFPALRGKARQAWGQTLVASILPASSLGVALTYDFHRRFATDNHRLGARLNLRATDSLTLTTFLRGGKTRVVPAWSADAGALWRLSSRLSLGARYNWDKMTWPGMLHRGTVSATSQLVPSLVVRAEYFGGLMRHCGDSDLVQGTALRTDWNRGPLALGVRYAFGVEVERPPLPAYLAGRLGDDFCLGDLGQEIEGSPLDLVETRAHDVGGMASLELTSSTHLAVGYGIQLRFDDTEVHRVFLTLQQAI